MKRRLQCVGFILFGFCVLHFSAHEVSMHEGHGSGRINPFLEILKSENLSHSNVLPVTKLDKFVTHLLQHLKCVDGGPTTSQPKQTTSGQCLASVCIDVTDLIRIAAVNTSRGVREEEFETICLVLLHFVTQVQSHCHRKVDMSNVTVELVADRLVKLSGATQAGQVHLHDSDITKLLDTFKDFLIHDNEHDHEDHTDGHENHDHGTHEGHDHDTTHEGHDHEHKEDEALVMKEQCLSGDALLYSMGESHAVDLDELSHLATFIIYFITLGYDVENKCRLLPNKGEFLDNLFLNFAADGINISLSGLENLMTKLAINPKTHADAEHDHGDVHSHRKRSVRRGQEGSGTKGTNFELSARTKRQAADKTSFQKCYTAKQIMAVYDSPNGIDQTSFKQLCPSLISQKLYADCSQQEEEVKSTSTEAERYGYSTIATAIICLCSVFGVIFIPCVSQTVYDILMSTFVGLAVGTLFADAVLHLIPMTLGVHSHGGHEGHDHDHGDGIVVESYLLFGLALMGGLYFFYILETVMSRFGGHSLGLDIIKKETHSHSQGDTDLMVYPNTHAKSPTFEEDAEPPKEKSGKNYVVHADSPGMLPDQKPNNKTCGLTPVALMIIIGDGIHNFADGLAIGASFTSSISAGIATSIAVFCHELPHELGDFAVLLQSGLSFKKAVVLNLASALTAFAGLYVSLSVSHGEEAQRWIFAVTSGMFLYIALVDLLPQLIKTTGHLNFTLNNLGILLGFAIMLVIAIFEEHIKI